MKRIDKPTGNFPSFYQPYIDFVPNDGGLLQHLTAIIPETEALLATLSEEQL
jgi:hypothetical protein